MTSRTSRSSSALSSAGSPPRNTPPPPRSPSFAFSPTPAGPSSEDELAGGSDGGKRKVNHYGFDASALPTTRCEWGGCEEEFYELEPLMEHLHTAHALPINPSDMGTKKALVYVCDWHGCVRRGKNQTSKFALISHLRSHTGEKPFNCPRPECDKSFTRTDALQKHMRMQHHETIVATRKQASKKRKTVRANSMDSVDPTSPVKGGAAEEEGEEEEEVVWTEEEEVLFMAHPGLDRTFLAYVVAKAKWAYLMGEHEGLLNELEGLGVREAELGSECEVMLQRIMERELVDPNAMDEDENKAALNGFLTSYSHDSKPIPQGWTVAQGPLRQIVTNGTSLGLTKVNLIKGVLTATANESWEIGTHMQALLEYDYPTLSPFFPSFNPPPTNPLAISVINLAAAVVSTKNASLLPLIADTSSGDPASIGVGVLLSAETIGSAGGQGSWNVTGPQFGTAAAEQIRYLMEVAPRTIDGAISHRADQVQLWADFVYMAPPFLAYYGVLTGNTTLIQAAYDQCRLYRQYLRRPAANGLWAHIVLGTNADPGYWATGNAWAAAGMMRVLVTILHSSNAPNFVSQTNDLASWIQEIVNASFALQQPNMLFPNYFNQTTFSDAASVALLASVSYRLASLSLSNTTIAAAERSRLALYPLVNPTTGVLLPVVNPLSYTLEGTLSPEGQAFILLMEASWRDWVGGGGVSTGSGSTGFGAGISAASGRKENVWGTGGMLLAAGVVWVT